MIVTDLDGNPEDRFPHDETCMMCIVSGFFCLKSKDNLQILGEPFENQHRELRGDTISNSFNFIYLETVLVNTCTYENLKNIVHTHEAAASEESHLHLQSFYSFVFALPAINDLTKIFNIVKILYEP